MSISIINSKFIVRINRNSSILILIFNISSFFLVFFFKFLILSLKRFNLINY